eukprot:2065740-Pyramimonas_sp.AAC.1
MEEPRRNNGVVGLANLVKGAQERPGVTGRGHLSHPPRDAVGIHSASYALAFFNTGLEQLVLVCVQKVGSFS